ncbi:gustatory receptor 5a for trehalose-like [Schistocerca piceifrons]|uniref:gustatory receptor 5a for trehalose-like n=1 Tax=Schistocerca piceifrons TaxID=274613 RepID=UPI001F5E8526|nr:gustatory receptor 5a for trehalose-like [Schistocerca piceifrons]
MRLPLRAAVVCGLLPAAAAGAGSCGKRAAAAVSVLSSAAYVTLLVLTAAHIADVARRDDDGLDEAAWGMAFYGNALLSQLVFARLSRRWPQLLSRWALLERDALPPPLARRVALTAAAILFGALYEHALSVSVALRALPPAHNPLEAYVRRTHPFLFSATLLPAYRPWLAPLVLPFAAAATCVWNFGDLFLILVASGLAALLRGANARISAAAAAQPARKGPLDNAAWWRLRELFADVAAFIKDVDDAISPLMLLSFANNLYFICLQLLKGISHLKRGSVLESVYLVSSFGFLLVRACWVTLSAAAVYDEGRAALPHLFACPALCPEAQRLQFQISSDNIVLTGMRFFSITRNFMLGVAGAIVTYEVVLLQFSVQRSVLNATMSSR